MRLGRVQVTHSYVVDLDNETMIEEAKDALYEDLTNAAKEYDLYSMIHVYEDQQASKDEIPDFLRWKREDDNDE